MVIFSIFVHSGQKKLKSNTTKTAYTALLRTISRCKICFWKKNKYSSWQIMGIWNFPDFPYNQKPTWFLHHYPVLMGSRDIRGGSWWLHFWTQLRSSRTFFLLIFFEKLKTHDCYARFKIHFLFLIEIKIYS